MWRFVRLQLALLPYLWAAFTEGDPAPSDPPKSDPPADDKKFTQADLDRIVKDRLDAEKARRDKDAEKAKAEADAAKAKADGELQKLADIEKARADKAEAERDAERLQARERVARAEAKAIATTLGFANPDLAWRLLDHDALTFDDTGVCTNAEALLTALATAEPYLVKSETTPPRGTPPGTKPGTTAPENAGAQFVKERYGKLPFKTT